MAVMSMVSNPISPQTTAQKIARLMKGAGGTTLCHHPVIARRQSARSYRMVTSIRSWIDEERSAFLVEALEDQSQTLSEVVQAIERHRSLIGQGPATA